MKAQKINDLSLRDAAVAYATAGLKIFPLYSITDGKCNCHKGESCQSPGKHPRTMNGLSDATSDIDTIIKWWEMWPESNIGMPTGTANGFVVVDIDGNHGGSPDDIDLPETLMQASGSGVGYHYLYRQNGTEMKSRTGVLPGIDSRAEGGYIVVAPSRHISGNQYYWFADPLSYDIPYPPQWWVDKTQRNSTTTPAYMPGPTEQVLAGGRNDYLTRIAGKRRAAGDSESVIIAYISALNKEKCNPPLDDDEVYNIAHSVSRYKTEEDKNKERAERGSAMLALMNKSRQEQIQAELNIVHDIQIDQPKHLIPEAGLITDIAEYILSQSRYPQPALAMAAAVSFIGALMGRKYETQTGLRSNVYLVGLAGSGMGKDAARKAIMKIAQKSGLMHYMGASEIASGAGLISALAEQPVQCFLLDEFGLMLQAMTGFKADAHKKQIINKFMELYSTAGSVYNGTAYADRKKSPNHIIVDPCAVLYGTSTHDSFYRGISSAEAIGGMVARFIIIDAGKYRGKSQMFEKRDPPADLITKVKAFAEFYHNKGNLQTISIEGKETSQPLRVFMHDEVAVKWDELDNKVTDKMDSDAAASIYSRVAENTAKLALIYAVSKNYVKPSIDAESFIWAREIAMWSANMLMKQLLAYMGDNEIERRNKQVINLVQSAGKEGMTKTQLTHKTLFWQKYERDAFIESMIESGIFQLVEIPTATNKRKVYVHIDHI